LPELSQNAANMRWITTKQSANILECSERRVRYMIEAGILHAVRMGKRIYRLREDEVERAKTLQMIRPDPDKLRLKQSDLLSRNDLQVQIFSVYWSGAATDEDAVMLHAAIEYICKLAPSSKPFFFCRNVAKIQERHFVPAPMEKSSI